VTRLDTRALNRALLDRQHLLRRTGIGVAKMVEHVVGMQSQVPDSPYIALWSRLDPYDPNDLGRLVESRRAVRLTLMRKTLHLVTVRDCLRLRPVFQPMIAAGVEAAGLDVHEIVAAGRAILEDQPLSRIELGRRLAERFGGHDPIALASIVVWSVPLLQVPPRGIWGRKGSPTWAPIESWLGKKLSAAPKLDALVFRYLNAFGPATVADAHGWSRLNRLRPVFERLRPKLKTYRDEHNRELFDVAERSLPDPDTPAPPRFLPDFDNVLIGHADRSRVFLDDRNRIIGTPTVLIDGFVRATWKVERKGAAAVLSIRPITSLTKAERSGVVDEGMRVLGFLAPGAEPADVHIAT
jgi:hypothetical protein